MRLKTLNSEELRQCCKEFAENYYEGVNEKRLQMECPHLTEYFEIQSKKIQNSILEIYHLSEENKIEDTFPSVEITSGTL